VRNTSWSRGIEGELSRCSQSLRHARTPAESAPRMRESCTRRECASLYTANDVPGAATTWEARILGRSWSAKRVGRSSAVALSAPPDRSRAPVSSCTPPISTGPFEGASRYSARSPLRSGSGRGVVGIDPFRRASIRQRGALRGTSNDRRGANLGPGSAWESGYHRPGAFLPPTCSMSPPSDGNSHVLSRPEAFFARLKDDLNLMLQAGIPRAANTPPGLSCPIPSNRVSFRWTGTRRKARHSLLTPVPASIQRDRPLIDSAQSQAASSGSTSLGSGKGRPVVFHAGSCEIRGRCAKADASF